MRPHQPLVSRWLPTIHHLIPLLRVCRVHLAAAEPLRRSGLSPSLSLRCFFLCVPWFLAGIDASLQGPGRRALFGVRPPLAFLWLLSARSRGSTAALSLRALSLLRICEARAAQWQFGLAIF